MPPSLSLHHHLLLLFPFPSNAQTLNPLSASPRLHPPSKSPASSLLKRPLVSSPSSFAVAAVDEFDEDVAIGDCLVFEDDAFEEPDLDLPSPAPSTASRPRRKPAAEGGGGGSLVPDKWRDAAEEINMTKKEKRRIAHGLRFGSRLERRAPPAVAAPDEYRAYREGRLDADLGRVERDYAEPIERSTVPDRVEAPQPPVPGTRVAPRNPRMGMGARSLDDITELFSSTEYVPGEMEDGSNPKGRRKLFTDEEKVLLNKRLPDLEAATSSKWLPLHTIAASGDFYLLDNLLKHNIDVNALDKDGLLAIHKAIISKKHAIINYLLRNSANPFIRDKDGATLMHYAVQTACSQTIKTLLLYNVDINHADDYGWTPLHLAVQTQRTDIVKLLLIKGSDRTLKTQDGFTPLELCLQLGHHARTYELIKLLKSFCLPKHHDPVQHLDGI
ncbi:ankyrin repeat domain-containing protein, chloroplastic [Oryza brachyantha]|uniref:ankyrin repeat domain-containing protein, chloroplastic n=1 Tax=Oryza brachyantha TaxID=4533 RepID=UPI001ADCABD0|nr:ankyrin repeat domain-containing protein, chloroplastic [Oryza brachyantha]XP_040378427.1 ankyrin repeat domain-containing protein, chloroplastic [Oryza brachyantha]XP_040378428.1 ankyrin repeat domain-containing protein, chloroplastic [Oryza brachyantha]XP_040378429.1 ankyrin repeat domain-containing protein, chloroplastic [Oryza brachyantha]XP_040378430.1 ankyrin repeat domain-containing protein, chloroplastic [Oryza brachyantha]